MIVLFLLFFLEACCFRYLGDYIPTNVFPLHVYFGKMAGYFERKEEKQTTEEAELPCIS